MTASVSVPYCGLIGVYVTLNDRGSIVREQVGFDDIREYREWVVFMRERYPNAHFACFALTGVDLLSLD